MSALIRAVGVLVPARDEEDGLGRCLDAVFVALRHLPSDVTAAVCLVVDRSRDDTAGVAHRAIRRSGRGRAVDVLVNGQEVSVGALRNRAARRLLERLAPAPLSSTWLLSTDADSRVDADWALRHLALADAGADAVAGGVRPDGPVTTWVDDPEGLYAANLGLRAGPFLQVEGFPEIRFGEDGGVVRRFRSTGHQVVVEPGLTVATSARLVGRADGGLADLLSSQARISRPDAGTPTP
ncbi:glycosyltransferase [Pseudonocardia endophytica]|uniref:Glycosyl transferase family 2 n=1 Tax=Pseudonocardia endophytica TaxID=401976 RepID=A0A4R1HHP0_PSEEN|nr:glycosyltransferase family A protein [Pseudonocardia endophytica]TCK21764.1 glycosyl transferase family 2 [Pseudonocardia endophytica]